MKLTDHDMVTGETTVSYLPDWDHDTRTVTTYDETGAVTSTRPYTEAENAAAVDDTATLTDMAARVARIEAHLWPAPPDPTTSDDPTVDDWDGLGGIWPNEGLLREDGIIWRNVSGVPLTTPPSGFPGAASKWGHLFVAVLTPEPEPTGAHDAYSLGDQRTHNGRLWESTVAGVRTNTWAPGVYGWKDIGDTTGS